MRISYWSSDVCSSDLRLAGAIAVAMIYRRRGGPFDGRRLRQILITHLLVRLEAAARENHAVLGLLAQRLAVVFAYDADDAAVLFDQPFHAGVALQRHVLLPPRVAPRRHHAS